MSLLGLELSDAGIMLAGSDPVQLIELDGAYKESPAYAFPEKNQLVVGKAAEKKAHLLPRLVTSHFWDQLNTEPLDHPGPFTQQNHAEIACAHIAQIWENVKMQGSEIIVAVPGFYHKDQLELLLGIASELSLPVNGFIPMALAAAKRPCLQKALFHLDIHLHRTEVVFLSQGKNLTCEDSVTIAEIGLAYLYRAWVESIAAEFVRSTRFDPLHQAASEQELFDRLPVVLEQLHKYSSVDFEMAGSSASYRVALTRELLIKKSKPLFADIARIVDRVLTHRKAFSDGVALQLTHRIARLPGLKESLAGLHRVELVELAPGAAAFGALRLWDQLSRQKSGQQTSFFTSRPWESVPETDTSKSPDIRRESRSPSHLLYRNLAYPLSERPLFIGLDLDPANPGIRIEGQISGVSHKHCSVELRGTQVVLNDFSTYGTFVDDIRVDGSITLQIGQTIRVGTPGEKLQLIACLDNNET
jgi:hypothetical protein